MDKIEMSYFVQSKNSCVFWNRKLVLDIVNSTEMKKILNDQKYVNYKVITIPNRYLIENIDMQKYEYCNIHPLAQLYIIHFLKNNYSKFENYFELNEVFSKKYNKVLFNGYLQNKNNIVKKLEQKYSNLIVINYDNYKNHVYTHSIDWAYLGDRELAKKHLSYKNRFSSKLDTLLQKSNYNETNGIIDGVLFSDFVGNIVLTRIDRLVYDELKNEKYHFKNDYEVLREDEKIYIFSHDSNLGKHIIDIYINNSRIYRLSINERVKEFNDKPFFINHLWQSELDKLISLFFEKFIGLINEGVNYKEDIFEEWFINIKYLMISNKNNKKIIIYILREMNKKIKENISKDMIINYIRNKDISDYFKKLYNILYDICSLDMRAENVNLLLMNFFYLNNLVIDDINIYYYLDDVTFNICFDIIKYNMYNFNEIKNVFIAMSFCKKTLAQGILLNYFNKNDENLKLCILFYLNKKNLIYKYKKIKVLAIKHYLSMIDNIDSYYNINEESTHSEVKVRQKKCMDLMGNFNFIIIMSIKKLQGLKSEQLQLAYETYKLLFVGVSIGNDSIEGLFLREIRNMEKSYIDWGMNAECFFNNLLYYDKLFEF